MCCCSDPRGRGVSVGEQSSTSTHSRGGGVWCRVFFCGACSESVMRRSGTTGAARSVGAHTETEEREAHDPVQVRARVSVCAVCRMWVHVCVYVVMVRMCVCIL